MYNMQSLQGVRKPHICASLRHRQGWVKPGTQPTDTSSFKCNGLPLGCCLNLELSLLQVPSLRLILFATAMSHPALCPGQARPVKSGRGPCHGSIPGLLLPPWRHLHTLMKNSRRGAEPGQIRKLQSRGGLTSASPSTAFIAPRVIT